MIKPYGPCQPLLSEAAFKTLAVSSIMNASSVQSNDNNTNGGRREEDPVTRQTLNKI